MGGLDQLKLWLRQRSRAFSEAVPPCILWIDEIEKGLAGARGSQGDSGVSARVLGTLLTWMEEKKKAVFVIATANHIGLEDRHLEDASKATVPLSQSMGAQIARLREEARTKWRMASGPAAAGAADVALGITFYELLTGVRPFTGQVGEVVQKILTASFDEALLRERRVDARIVRVLAAVRAIASRLSEERGRPRRLYHWRVSTGLRDEKGQLLSADSVGDLTAALLHVIDNPKDSIYVFSDLHRHFTPVVVRLVRDAARAVRLTRKSALFLSPSFQFPQELEKEMSLALFQLPDREQLQPLLERLAEECRAQGLLVDLSQDDQVALLRAVSGLTLNEAERALRLAVARLGGFRPQAAGIVVREKTQIIRKTGILDYYHSSESFAHVGVPGCGKSLSARALAGAWGAPLLRLDVGRIFGPIVGESEANLRRAIQTAEAVSPCILRIDEVEKGFAGVRSESGGGVALRVFGSFLSWLQDKRSPVFVVATANDLSGIPPEFLRQGRFDDIFFGGLPEKLEREVIFRIHLGRRRRDPEKFDLAALADIAGALNAAYPLSRARAAEIASLTEWARWNARPASARVPAGSFEE